MIDCKIYVITHKKMDLIKIPGYKSLLVGANNNNSFENDYLLDNTGDNISDKNDSYCELTGLYWMWKNTSSTYIGLVHYRRFFARLKRHLDYRGRHVFISTRNAYKILDLNDCEKYLKENDLIVKSSEYRIRNNESIFRNQFGEELFGIIDNMFHDKYREYLPSYKKVLDGHTHLNCNMFIGKKSIIDEYCEWLFPFLKLVEEKHYDKYADYYHNREIGYIPELLFQVWIEHNKVSYEIVPVVCPEDPEKPTGVMNVAQFISFFSKKILERKSV